APWLLPIIFMAVRKQVFCHYTPPSCTGVPLSFHQAIRTSSCLPLAAIHMEQVRSEEHTSELQSRFDLVCRLLLEKKKSLVSERPAPRSSSSASSRATR